MSPGMLRQFWSLIEATQSHILLELDDSTLVLWLTRQLAADHPLNRSESSLYASYIRSRLPLIRDLARSRTVCP